MPSYFASFNPDERAELINTAMGRTPADIVVTNINLVSSTTGEILEDASIIIKGRRIARIGEIADVSKYISSRTIVIDGRKRYAVPGFIDLHIHIESTLLDPIGFSKIALKHGTTTVVADPHEIVNVLGLKGLEIFTKVSRELPLKILYEVPSCVPATDPSYMLETPGNIVSSREVNEALNMDGIIGLGEVMDFISVVNANQEVLSKIQAASERRMVIDGHAPLLSDEKLDAYIAAGILSDHESTGSREALEKLRRGMYIFIREGSAWRDLKALLPLIRDKECMLCSFVSDDVNVFDLFTKGHMDRIINLAIEYGVDPVKAIQYATINPALRLHLEDQIGSITPGRLGDIVITERIDYIKPVTTIANGSIIYYEGELKKVIKKAQYPEEALNTVKIGADPSSLSIPPRVEVKEGSVLANVIEVTPGSALTKWRILDVEVSEHKILPDPSRDIMYITVIDRHKATGSHSSGLIKGLGFKAGAIAQTIAHDTHNLIVAGWSKEDMMVAVERVIRLQGGIVIVDNGKIVSEIELKLAGLMSIKEPDEVFREYLNMVNTLRTRFQLDFESFFMTLALVSLPVIPDLRITDKGLVDVMKGRLVPLVVEASRR